MATDPLANEQQQRDDGNLCNANSQQEEEHKKPLCKEEVFACSIDRWYEQFKELTYETEIFPLSDDFVKYLSSDGICVPRTDVDDDDSSSSSSSDEDDDSKVDLVAFAEFQARLAAAIKRLGGAVLPKLNWSAPKDASWVFSTIRCENVPDLLTVMKASDFISHDLFNSLDDCADADDNSSAEGVSQTVAPPHGFCLALRKWQKIEESSEFRCFVCDGKLRAVSQRITAVFFEHLTEESFFSLLKEAIVSFYENKIAGKFPLERFAFDVSVGKAPGFRVRLVDFSPFGESTEPLLFDWADLRELDEGGDAANAAPEIDFRIVKSEAEVRHGRLENYHAVPVEVANFGAQTPESLDRLIQHAGLETNEN